MRGSRVELRVARVEVTEVGAEVVNGSVIAGDEEREAVAEVREAGAEVVNGSVIVGAEVRGTVAEVVNSSVVVGYWMVKVGMLQVA